MIYFIRHPQMGPVTSAVGETHIVSHRTEVLEEEDGEGGHQQQHDKHHDPDVSAKGLYRDRNTREHRDITHTEKDRTCAYRGTLRVTPSRCYGRP